MGVSGGGYGRRDLACVRTCQRDSKAHRNNMMLIYNPEISLDGSVCSYTSGHHNLDLYGCISIAKS